MRRRGPGLPVILAAAVFLPSAVRAQAAISADGVVESTAGGFKFPDGTIQTTAAETDPCPTLDPSDEMVFVGGVCIDKYEASIWDAPVGGSQIENHMAIPCDADGQDCFDKIWARSVPGVEPRADITWFQAQQAAANSGKRLPTNAEWQMAVAGTPDPGLTPGTEDCNTNSVSAEATGERANCVSHWATHDTIGNLWEWVADWVPASTACPSWGAFSDDAMCLAGASTVVEGPGALVRGGSWDLDSAPGAFAVSGFARPQQSNPNVGFRAAR